MSVRIPKEWTEQAKSFIRLIVHEPFRKRSWAELAYFLASSALVAVSQLAFGVLGLLGVGLTVAFVGIVILAGGLRLARGVGRLQRSLAFRLLGEEIPEPDAFAPSPGLFKWLGAALSDRSAWRTVAYVLVRVPLTILGIWFALSVWIESLSTIVAPFFGGAGVQGFGFTGPLLSPLRPGYPFGPAARLGVFLIGVALLFVAPWPMRFVVYIDGLLMHLLLGPDAVASRVRSLEQSRSKTLDVATATLRRIERDLHDGTQAQLVALAMRLGQANEKLESLATEKEPDELAAIRQLVSEAHRGAKEAITDLRDLARGIHPPALDTGLENALATLAARSPVATEVTVAIENRPSQAVEAICYFCAAELLANVAQHSEATRAALTCAQHGPWLRVVVRDNGHGGAAIRRQGSSSSGLAGLADRIAAVDGHISIVSPPGGPTAITIDLPANS